MPSSSTTSHGNNSAAVAAIEAAMKQIDAILCGMPSYESRFTVLEHIRVRWLAGYAETAHDTEDEDRTLTTPTTPTSSRGAGAATAAVGLPRLEDEDPSIKSAIEQLRTQCLILDIPQRAPMMTLAQLDQLKGNATISTPFTHALMKHGFDIRLGEQGRSGLKQEISKCCRGSVELRDACSSIARLKTASIPQLIQLAEVCGILPKALKIAQKYWRTKRRRGPANGSNSPVSADRDDSTSRGSPTFTDEAATPRATVRSTPAADTQFVIQLESPAAGAAQTGMVSLRSPAVSATFTAPAITVAAAPATAGFPHGNSGSGLAVAGAPTVVVSSPAPPLPQQQSGESPARQQMTRAELALAQAVAADNAGTESQRENTRKHGRPLTPDLESSAKAPRLAMAG